MLTIFATDYDGVIDAVVGQGRATYNDALELLYPLIDRLEIQRKVQDSRFYNRLSRDLLHGCVMPAITIAFIETNIDLCSFSNEELQDYACSHITQGFILDGIQRLNALRRTKDEDPKNFPSDRPLYFSILVCKSMDKLLYRMITLNNGQRPMTTRHQVEILTSRWLDFSRFDMEIIPEKSKGNARDSFKQADFILGYLAFCSDSTAIDNRKLIESKLDELLAFKILERDLTDSHFEFSEVLILIASLVNHEQLRKWFQNANNLIGFCSAIRQGYAQVNSCTDVEFYNIIQEFEKAFSSISPAKVRLGQARRKAVHHLIANFEEFYHLSNLEMMEKIAVVL